MAQQVVDEKQGDFTLVEVKDIPSKMKALQLMAYDKDMSKALALNEIDVPACGADQILIKTYSVSLNPVDWKVAMGYLSKYKDVNFPRTIGRDYSGVIVKIGENVKDTDFKVGMRVAGMVDLFGEPGSFSEYIATKPVNAAKMADGLSYDMGAGIPLVTITSYQALMNYSALKDTKGLKVIILGGSSSCGLAAIQVARNQGASEIAVTSSQVDLCTKHGATKVYNYKDKDAKKWFDDLKGQNYDLVFDCVGGSDAWQAAQSVLKEKDATYISIVSGAQEAGGNPNITYKYFMEGVTKGMQAIYDSVNEKKLTVVLDEDTPYTVDKWADMLAKSIAHKAHGKLIMRFCE